MVQFGPFSFCPLLLSVLDFLVVASKDTYSGPEVEIAEWLVEQGLPTTPRQVRTWRAKRWLVPAVVEAHGYAKKPTWFNPPESFEQARLIAEVRGGKRTNPHVMVLRLFARGHRLPMDQLRAAFRWYLRSIRGEFAKAARGTSDLDDAAELVAAEAAKIARKSKAGRRLLKGTDSEGKAAENMLASVMTVLVQALQGEDIGVFDHGGDDAIDEIINFSGMRGMAEDTIEGSGPIVTGGRDELRGDIEDYLWASSLEAMENAVATATYDELAQSRDLIVPIITSGASFARNIKRGGTGPANAFGMDFLTTFEFNDESMALLSLIMLPQISRLGLERVVSGADQIRPAFDRQSAIDQLLTAVPRRLLRYVTKGGSRRLETASQDDRDAVAAALQEFQQAHPDVWALAIGTEAAEA